MHNAKAFGNLLIEFRRRSGKPIRVVALEAGIEENTLKSYFQGKPIPRDKLYRFLKATYSVMDCDWMMEIAEQGKFLAGSQGLSRDDWQRIDPRTANERIYYAREHGVASARAIGELLKDFQYRSGRTLEEIAADSGLNAKTFESAYFLGSKPIPPEKLYKFLKATGSADDYDWMLKMLDDKKLLGPPMVGRGPAAHQERDPQAANQRIHNAKNNGVLDAKAFGELLRDFYYRNGRLLKQVAYEAGIDETTLRSRYLAGFPIPSDKLYTFLRATGSLHDYEWMLNIADQQGFLAGNQGLSDLDRINPRAANDRIYHAKTHGVANAKEFGKLLYDFCYRSGKPIQRVADEIDARAQTLRSSYFSGGSIPEHTLDRILEATYSKSDASWVKAQASKLGLLRGARSGTGEDRGGGPGGGGSPPVGGSGGPPPVLPSGGGQGAISPQAATRINALTQQGQQLANNTTTMKIIGGSRGEPANAVREQIMEGRPRVPFKAITAQGQVLDGEVLPTLREVIIRPPANMQPNGSQPRGGMIGGGSILLGAWGAVLGLLENDMQQRNPKRIRDNTFRALENYVRANPAARDAAKQLRPLLEIIYDPAIIDGMIGLTRLAPKELMQAMDIIDANNIPRDALGPDFKALMDWAQPIRSKWNSPFRIQIGELKTQLDQYARALSDNITNGRLNPQEKVEMAQQIAPITEMIQRNIQNQEPMLKLAEALARGEIREPTLTHPQRQALAQDLKTIRDAVAYIAKAPELLDPSRRRIAQANPITPDNGTWPNGTPPEGPPSVKVADNQDQRVPGRTPTSRG